MRILITAGPTREFFDTVRFISNPSSGKMGYALAAVATMKGHDVALVSGPVSIDPPPGIKPIQVVSAQEMFEVSVALFAECQAAIMTAAVCDYRPIRILNHKLQKHNRDRPLILKPTPDICAHLGSIKERRVVIGFAMEDHDHKAHAQAKLSRKHCDAIILNGPDNVGGQKATVEILTADGQWSPPISGTKSRIAQRIVRLTEQIYARKDRAN